MFKNLSYKKKTQLLLAGSVLFGFIAYSISISKTIDLIKQCNALSEKSEVATTAPQEIQTLQAELQRISSILGSEKRDDQPARELLLEFLTDYCQSKRTVLREIPQTITNIQGDLSIETNTFTVEGNFVNLLMLVYELEQKQKIGKINSVSYQSKKDQKTKKPVLTVTIYMQNIKKQES